MPEDRGKAIAWKFRESKRCRKCGLFSHEWIDPETKRPVRPAPLEAVVHVCEPCLVSADASDEIPEKDERRPGMSIKWQATAPEVDDD